MGHFYCVVGLLDAGAEMNVTNNNGYTALHIAIRHKHIDVLRILLSKGASLDTKSKAGSSGDPKSLSPLEVSRDTTFDHDLGSGGFRND